MSSEAATPNTFTHGPLGAIFAKTALPIIFVMSMNGLLAVVDAVFLGVFVGPDALGAVTLMFPLYMLIVALATLVAGGIPLTFLLPLAFGEEGIWMAGPIAELFLIGPTAIVLSTTARSRDLRWGLFNETREVRP